MKVRKYKWILVFFMLWLPLQGAAAAALSVCAQEKDFNPHYAIATTTIENHHHDDCHKQTTRSITDHLLANLPCDDTSCDAYGNTPVLSSYTALMLTNDTSVIASFNSGFTSFVPDQPQRPPLISSLH